MKWTTFGIYMLALVVLAVLTIIYLAHGGDPLAVVIAWFGGVFFILAAQALLRAQAWQRRA